MNCREWEERIALYAGGDLPSTEAVNAERHLADCVGCQVFLSGLKQSLELLREVHQEPVAAADFAAVRYRLLTRLKGDRIPWWRRRWVYGFALGAAALIATLAVWWGLTPAPPPRLALYRPPAPEVAIAPVTSPRPVHAARVSRVRHEPKRLTHRAAKPAEPLVVKLITDNPDVVIYWISEKEGDVK